MNYHEKLDILKERNPFTSSSAGDPWEGKYPDVESVNRNAFEGICQLIKQKSADPAENFAGLVLGDVGSGKTHLIGRILEYGKRADPPFSFAYIQPIEDPEQPYRYLLREVMVNLCHPIDGASGTSHLDRILSEIFREEVEKIFRSSKVEKHIRFLGKLRRDPTEIFRNDMMTSAALKYVEERTFRFMTGEYPEFPDNFLKVLLQHWIPEKRPASVNWLKGSVMDDEDAALLEVPGRQNKSDAFLEQEARNILRTFGILMMRYGQPMVICFDRLENLETNGQIHSLGKMIEFLVDAAKAMLPVICFRTLQWDCKFRNKINRHVATRLENNTFRLEGCSTEQALEIIRCRLSFVTGEDRENDLFPFDRNELTRMFEAGLESPREIISRANHQLRKILGKMYSEPLSAIGQLQDEFESLYQHILSDFSRYQPDRERLRRALELFLKYVPSDIGFQIEGLTRPVGKEKHADFECTVKPAGSHSVKAIFIIDVEQNHTFAESNLKAGIDFFSKFPSGKAFYIRDARSPFPSLRWSEANEMLEEFRKRGGHVIFLDDKQAARWYALALLNYAVNEGDVTIMDADNQMKFVSSEAFASFIREKIHGKAYPVFQDFDKALELAPIGGSTEPPAQLSDEDIVKSASDTLELVPMMILNSQMLAKSLNQSGIAIDLEGMLRVIGRFKDRFEVIPSADGVLIRLKKGVTEHG
ncbi:hypothetical protein QUF72_08485 [Desulfobacterales bacterium HSG2]|nr:hypothetical protein [Desulfobacterales bacterium HSG2]